MASAVSRSPRTRAFRRAIGRLAARFRNGSPDLFSAAGLAARFAPRTKIGPVRRPSLRFGPSGAVPRRPPPFVAMKAARGAAPVKGDDAMTHDHSDLDTDPHQSATGYLLQELALHGYRPFEDEPDPRPLPEGRHIDRAMADIFDAMVSTLTDTRIEPDLEGLLWSLVNVFQRGGERVERELDDNEQGQKRLQREQDGSEVKSVELERAINEGRTLIERRDTMEYFCDAAAEQYRHHLRRAWTPRSGSQVNRKALTSAVVDSRDFINARRYADQQVLMPPGTRIYVSAGTDYNDVDRIWAALDKVHDKHPVMVLLHGGGETGGERIAAAWAENRGVPAIAFRPDWRLRRAAPFKRNDRVVDAAPQGVLVFPGNGIQDNMADKARAAGIALMDFRKNGRPR